MPNFSDAEIEEMRVQRVNEVLDAHVLDPHGRAVLEKEQAHLETQVASQDARLRRLRDRLGRVSRKLCGDS